MNTNNEEGFYILENEEIKNLCDKFKSTPQGIFKVSENQIAEMKKLIPNGLSADIIMSGIIPLHDIIIDFDVFNNFLKTEIIVLNDSDLKEYTKYLQETMLTKSAEELKFTKAQPVLLMKLSFIKEINTDFIVPIYIRADKLMLAHARIYGIKVKDKKNAFFDIGNNVVLDTILNDDVMRDHLVSTIQTVGSMVSDFLYIWYALQIALLNPEIKECFIRDTVVEEVKKNKNNKKKTAKKKKPVLKYIKRIQIDDSMWNKTIKHTKKHKIECQYWYVVGHYRTYKNGKKKFINGYWKGPLKNAIESSAISLIDIRERKI